MAVSKNKMATRTVSRTAWRLGRRKADPRFVSTGLVPTATGAVNKYVLTEAGYDRIESLARDGIDLASIAKALGISPDAFRTLRREDPEAQAALDRGVGGLADTLTNLFLVAARDGNITAAIFLAKTRAGFVENAPPPASSPQTAVQVNISIPEPLSRERFLEIVGPLPPEVDDA